MASLLLIDPCGWQGGVKSDRLFPNIGIAYLVAALRGEGHEVLVADMNNESLCEQDVIDLMRLRGIRVAGLSVKTATMGAARSLGTRIKRELGALILVGGAHASLEGTGLSNEEWVDFVFRGEAEENLLQFCRNLEKGIAPSLGVIQQAKALNCQPVYVQDLDRLPFPDYSLFPRRVQEEVSRNYPLVTSRGCVFDCTYCSVPLISGKRFRKRTPENIVLELTAAKERLGIEEFNIIDDAFNLDMARAKQFCRLLLERQLELRWSCPNGLRADFVDAELAELMRRSGCYSVMLGVESGDHDVFAGIKKGETLEQVSRGIRTFQNAGIQVGGYFLIGLPGDSLSAQLRSVHFALQHGLVAHFNMLIPYPGTTLWDWVRTHGRLLRDIEQGLHFADSAGKVLPVFETTDFNASLRSKAYELVHTRVGRFDMLMPNSLTTWRRKLAILKLILRYDPKQLVKALKRRTVKIQVAGNK